MDNEFVAGEAQAILEKKKRTLLQLAGSLPSGLTEGTTLNRIRVIFIPISICLVRFPTPPRGLGQSPVKAPEFGYDYKSLAIDSILSSANEGAKLPGIEERVTLLVPAVQMLPASPRDDAIRFLNLALSDLKDWTGDKDKKWGRSDSARLGVSDSG